ncbi:hypothetical protein Leryth_017798 [Lithospermum erythrorhizon]|nr:hypothetical protein Leryth_017798 [Lithospermum erythrorhizon]
MNIDLHHHARLLNTFKNRHDIIKGKQLHVPFLKRGVLNSCVSIANRLLQMYACCGEFSDARKLFDEMPERNCFTWNTLIEQYMKRGEVNESLELFYSMPDKNDYSWNVVVCGLVSGGELDVARGLFDEMPRKSVKAWNSLINGYAKKGYLRMALRLFTEFLGYDRCGASCLDAFLLATVIGVCAQLRGLRLGRQIHTRIVAGEVEFDAVLKSSLVNMYGKCGDLDSASNIVKIMENPDDFSVSALISGYANCGRINDARRTFDAMSNTSVVLWNSMIIGYVASNEANEALLLFMKMHKMGVMGDSSTFASVLSACASIKILKNSLQINALVCKSGYVDDVIVASALLNAYSNCDSSELACNLFSDLKVFDTILLNSMITIYCNSGRIRDAKKIFNGMPSRSLISWNAMIVGLSQNGFPIEALNTFCEMNRLNLYFDKFSLASVISACASISAVELGEQVFAKAIVIGIDSDDIFVTSLIDFYCKCGFTHIGRKLFDQMIKYDEVPWNSMLMGYAANGSGIEALNLFHEMLSAGIIPTDITFTAVLSACDHCGLVEEGRKWFNAMKQDYYIDPLIEHYSCMIDLLARAGCLTEAMHLIDLMPFKADASIWSSLLRGCVAHGNKSLGKKVVEHIMDLDSKNSGAFVQLSNIFASSEDWEGSAFVRKLMRDREIMKSPGRSWFDGNILRE